jgi:hypothetical protein
MVKDVGNPPWYSSYEKNNYGDIFYALMRIYKPNKVVELGTKAGYSAYHMVRGLKANGKGTLDCYDLWEEYQFNSVPRSTAEKNLKEFKNLISFHSADAINAEKKYAEVDILHVDLSNTGELLRAVIPQWIDKVRQIIIIEGGSKERDEVEWMEKFKKKSIEKWLIDFARKRGDIEYATIEPFPSITILRKK